MSVAAGRLVNRMLRPAGLRLQRFDPNARSQPQVPSWRHEKVLREYHDHLVATAFPDMPFTDGRLELLAQLEGQTVAEAMWILDSLHRCRGVEGDICEFGVAAGTTSALLANEIRAGDKTLWLFDSFQGLPKPSKEDELLDDFWNLGSMDAYEGKMNFPVHIVRSNLDKIRFPLSRVQIVEGFIEDTLQSDQVPGKVSFALVDVDFYQPVLSALSFLAGRVFPGARILVDDYGAFSSGAKVAVDEFVALHSGLFKVTFPPEWAGRFAILEREPVAS